MVLCDCFETNVPGNTANTVLLFVEGGAAPYCRDGEPGIDCKGADGEPIIYDKEGNYATLLAAFGISWGTTTDRNCVPFCFFA